MKRGIFIVSAILVILVVVLLVLHPNPRRLLFDAYVVVGVILTRVVELGPDKEVLRVPLDQLWEKHMLEGRGGAHMNGQPETVTAPAFPFAKERRGKGAGSPFGMLSTEYAIEVKDFRGTKFFGLLRGGGWTLLGGLLERLEIGSSVIDLYAKVVSPIHPGLFDHYYRPKEEQFYEFFLLHRKRGGPQGVIVKKWVIPPEQVRWFVPEHVLKGPLARNEKYLRQNETSDVRGYLRLDPLAKTATVTITGLTRPFKEAINLSEVLRD